jgi:hypothetical protein
MNCPACSEPLLFGAKSCPCGYRVTEPSEELPIELTYWEALRAYWRVYWPSQLLALGLMIILGIVMARSFWWLLLAGVVVGALTFFTYIPRIVSRPYQGFAIVVVDRAGAAGSKLRGAAWLQVFGFLWWRQLGAGLFAALLAMPLNILLGLMGLQVNGWVANAAGILIVGPLLLKMLIGNQFEAFRLEARRGMKSA